MTLDQLNQLSDKEVFDTLFKCCGSTRWAESLAAKRPFHSLEELLHSSDSSWSVTKEHDWLEAFSHHPKIGDVASLEKKFASTATWASGEQSAVQVAPREILERLAKGNADYESKFGFIFIVCATGKSAEEMLALLESRLPHERDAEIQIAASEQNKITHLRLKKLLG